MRNLSLAEVYGFPAFHTFSDSSFEVTQPTCDKHPVQSIKYQAVCSDNRDKMKLRTYFPPLSGRRCSPAAHAAFRSMKADSSTRHRSSRRLRNPRGGGTMTTAGDAWLLKYGKTGTTCLPLSATVLLPHRLLQRCLEDIDSQIFDIHPGIRSNTAVTHPPQAHV